LAPPSVGRSRSLFNRSEKLAHGVNPVCKFSR
jgi:hypothetical protein